MKASHLIVFAAAVLTYSVAIPHLADAGLCEDKFGVGAPYCVALSSLADCTRLQGTHSEIHPLEMDLCEALVAVQNHRNCSLVRPPGDSYCRSIQDGLESSGLEVKGAEVYISEVVRPKNKRYLRLFGKVLAGLESFISFKGGCAGTDRGSPVSPSLAELSENLSDVIGVTESVGAHDLKRPPPLVFRPLSLATLRKFDSTETRVVEAISPILGRSPREDLGASSVESIAQLRAYVERNLPSFQHHASQSDSGWHIDSSQTLLGPEGNAVKVNLFVDRNGVIYINFPEKILGRGATKTVSHVVKLSDVLIGAPTAQLVAASVTSARNDGGVDRLLQELAYDRAVTGGRGTQVIHFPGHKRNTTETVMISEFFNHGDFSKFLSAQDVNSEVRKTISEQLVEQLALCHAKGHTHGDLKPENILVKGEFPNIQATLADFGSTITPGALVPLPQKGELHDHYSGTPIFMAPEFAHDMSLEVKSAQSFDPHYAEKKFKSADVWAMGLTLYASIHKGNPSGCNMGKGVPLPSIIFALAKIESYDKVCEVCKIFCNPDKPGTTLAPAPDTFESIVYQMLNPNDLQRLTSEQSLDKLKLLRKS